MGRSPWDVAKVFGPRFAQEAGRQVLADEQSQRLSDTGEHGHRRVGDHGGLLMLQEQLRTGEWFPALIGRSARLEPRKCPPCQTEAATIDGADTGVADNLGQLLGKSFTKPGGCRGYGRCAGAGSSFPDQYSPKRPFSRVAGRHELSNTSRWDSTRDGMPIRVNVTPGRRLRSAAIEHQATLVHSQTSDRTIVFTNRVRTT
jgi:hypothetical protein